MSASFISDVASVIRDTYPSSIKHRSRKVTNEVNPQTVEDQMNVRTQMRLCLGVDVNEAYRYYVRGEGKTSADNMRDSGEPDIAERAIHSQLVRFLSSTLEKSVKQHSSGSDLHGSMSSPLGYHIKDYFRLAELRADQLRGGHKDIDISILEDVRHEIASYTVEKVKATSSNNFKVKTVLHYCDVKASPKPSVQSLCEIMQEKMEQWAKPSHVKIDLANDDNLLKTVFGDVWDVVISSLNDHRIFEITSLIINPGSTSQKDVLKVRLHSHQELVNRVVSSCLPFIHEKASEQIRELVDLPEFQSGEILPAVKTASIMAMQDRLDSYEGFSHQQREYILKQLQGCFGKEWVLYLLFSILGCAVSSSSESGESGKSNADEIFGRLQGEGPYFDKRWVTPSSLQLLYYDVQLVSSFLEGLYPDYFLTKRPLDYTTLIEMTPCPSARDMPTTLIQTTWNREKGSLCPWGSSPQFHTIGCNVVVEFPRFTGDLDSFERRHASPHPVYRLPPPPAPPAISPPPENVHSGDVVKGGETRTGVPPPGSPTPSLQSSSSSSSLSPSPMKTKMVDVSQLVPEEPGPASGKIDFFAPNNPLITRGPLSKKTKSRQPLLPRSDVMNDEDRNVTTAKGSIVVEKGTTMSRKTENEEKENVHPSDQMVDHDIQQDGGKRKRGRPKGRRNASSSKPPKAMKVRKGGLPVRKKPRKGHASETKPKARRVKKVVDEFSDVSSLSSASDAGSDSDDKEEDGDAVQTFQDDMDVDISSGGDHALGGGRPACLRMEGFERSSVASDFKIPANTGGCIIDPGSTFTKFRTLRKVGDDYDLGVWDEFRTDLMLVKKIHLSEDQFKMLHMTSLSSYDAGIVSSVAVLHPLCQELLMYFDLPNVIEQSSDVGPDTSRVWGVKAKSLIVSRTKILISDDFLSSGDVMRIPRFPITEDIQGLVLNTNKCSTGCYQVFRKLDVLVDGVDRQLLLCYDFLFVFKDMLVMKRVDRPVNGDIAVSTTGVLTEGESVNQHLKSLNIVTGGMVPRICAIPETDGLICGVVSADPTPGFKMVLDPGGVTGDILLAEVSDDEKGGQKINVLVKVCRPLATHALICRLTQHGGVTVKYSTSGRLECANEEVIRQSKDAIFQAVVNAFRSDTVALEPLRQIFLARRGTRDQGDSSSSSSSSSTFSGEFSVDGVIIHVDIDAVALVRVFEEYVHDCLQILMKHAGSKIKEGDKIRVFAVGKILTNRWGSLLLRLYLQWRQSITKVKFDLRTYNQHENPMTDGLSHVMKTLYKNADEMESSQSADHSSIVIVSAVHSSLVRTFPEDAQSSWGFITIVTVGPSKKQGNIIPFQKESILRAYGTTAKGSWMTCGGAEGQGQGEESVYLYEDVNVSEERGMYIIPFLFKEGKPEISYSGGIVSVVQNGEQSIVRLYEDHVVFLSYTVREFAKLFSFVNVLTRGVQGDEIRNKIVADVSRVSSAIFSQHQQWSTVFNWKPAVYSLLETLMGIKDQLNFQRFQDVRTPKSFCKPQGTPFDLLPTHLDMSDDFEKVLLYSSRVTENK